MPFEYAVKGKLDSPAARTRTETIRTNGQAPTVPQPLIGAPIAIAISVPCLRSQTSPPSPPSSATRLTTLDAVSGFRSTPVSTRQTVAGSPGGGSMYGRNSAWAIRAAGEGDAVSAA